MLRSAVLVNQIFHLWYDLFQNWVARHPSKCGRRLSQSIPPARNRGACPRFGKGVIFYIYRGGDAVIKLGCFAVLKDRDRPGQFMELERFVQFARQLRLDVIDFHLGKGFLSRDPEYLSRLKFQCLRAGLPIGYLGSGGGFVGTAQERQQRVEQAEADVDAAVLLGAPMIRLFGGHVPEGVEDREPLWGPMIACFQEVADYASARGIAVGLQNHDNRNMAATGEDVLRILRAVERENFTFILDTGQWKGSIGAHPRGQFDPAVDIYQYMAQTALHAAYVRAKIYKIDSGREEWIDYGKVLQLLKAAEFNGCMSIVFEGQGNRCSDEEAVRLATRHLRELLTSNC